MYKWNNARDWLEHRRGDNKFSDTEILNALLACVSLDDIEDVFGDEMQADGYYIEVEDD